MYFCCPFRIVSSRVCSLPSPGNTVNKQTTSINGIYRFILHIRSKHTSYRLQVPFLIFGRSDYPQRSRVHAKYEEKWKRADVAVKTKSTHTLLTLLTAAHKHDTSHGRPYTNNFPHALPNRTPSLTEQHRFPDFMLFLLFHRRSLHFSFVARIQSTRFVGHCRQLNKIC